MNLSTAADYSNFRAFNDETGYDAAPRTFASILLRVTGSFGGGLALTAMLAVLVHH